VDWGLHGGDDDNDVPGFGAVYSSVDANDSEKHNVSIFRAERLASTDTCTLRQNPG
jgi:hypothetical protein